MNKSFPFFRQEQEIDCGPACVKMILEFYGRKIDLKTISAHIDLSNNGSTFLDLSDFFETLGFTSVGLKIDINSLINDVRPPIIAHWMQSHFVVIHDFSTSESKTLVRVADPAVGLLDYSITEFKAGWSYMKKDLGFVLSIQPNFN